MSISVKLRVGKDKRAFNVICYYDENKNIAVISVILIAYQLISLLLLNDPFLK